VLDRAAGDIRLTPDFVLSGETGEVAAATVQNGMLETEQFFGFFEQEIMQLTGQIENRFKLQPGERRQFGDGRFSGQNNLPAALTQKLQDDLQAINPISGYGRKNPADGKGGGGQTGRLRKGKGKSITWLTFG
jgi:hypothetical protein